MTLLSRECEGSPHGPCRPPKAMKTRGQQVGQAVPPVQGEQRSPAPSRIAVVCYSSIFNGALT